MPALDPVVFDVSGDSPLSDELRGLVEAAPLPSLGSGPHDTALASALRSRSPGMQGLPSTALAGLWLLAGDLDASHQISQSISSAEGSFWHAIMHCREGDYENAKYWFRRVGSHPVLGALADTPYGDPLHFVDTCRQAMKNSRSESQRVEALQQLQWLEWQHLFAHCLAQAGD